MALLGQISGFAIRARAVFYMVHGETGRGRPAQIVLWRSDAGNRAAASGVPADWARDRGVAQLQCWEGMTSFVPERAAIGQWRRKAKGRMERKSAEMTGEPAGTAYSLIELVECGCQGPFTS